MDAIFQRAAAIAPDRSDQPRILGLRMQPLTLGHLFLLLEIQSPYVAGQDHPSTQDCFLAALICAQSPRQARKTLGAWWLPLFFRIWGILTIRRSILSEKVRFADYFAAQQACPRLYPKDGNRLQTCATPAPFRDLMFLLVELHIPRLEALDMPMSQVNALYVTWAEWTDRARVAVDPDDDLWNFAAAEDAKRFNEDGTRRSESSEVRGESRTDASTSQIKHPTSPLN